ncbi:MAG: hypothetical protein RQ966_12400 [Acetobacteraceae bacterium]|nr:hypothetical protein [Acetobacteraceae bacterium]
MAGLLTSALPLARAQAEASPKCAAPEDAAGTATPLPHVSDALRPGATLNVLAIGSATLFRPDASLAPTSLLGQSFRGATTTTVPSAQVMNETPSGTAFPQQMAAALERAVPGLKVKVTARGGRGLSATDQLQLLTEMLEQEKFQLVLWQTGTVEAVRNLPPSEFAQTLADGAEKTVQAGADLVLVDPQFSRFLQTNSNIEPYEQAFQYVGSMPNVLLFHRFDLMHSWVNDGQIDLERTPKIDRLSAVEHLHTCLGLQLSRLVLGGARS